LDQRAVVGGNRFGHPRGKLSLLRGRAELANPDRRLTSGVENLVRQPLELLLVSRVEGQRCKPVNHLSGAQPAQLTPEGDAGRGGFTR